MSDRRKALAALVEAGFTERQAKALIDVGGEGCGTLAAKADITDMATKTDLQALELRMTATLERRMNNVILQLAILQVAVGGLIVAALKLRP